MATISTLSGFVSGILAEKRVTKADLAQCLGIQTTQTLNTKLEGQSDFSLREAKKLAAFCGVSIEEICTLVYGS